jgi:uncharacterized protein
MPILIILFAVTLGITMWGRKKFRRVYEEEQANTISSGITGEELARKIIESKGISGVKIIKGRGILSDFYNPATRVLSLSPQHFSGSSYSGLGVAAHEAGHVIQHVEGHRPLLWRVSAVKFTVFLTVPLIILGIFLLVIPGVKNAGIGLLTMGWSLVTMANLVTLPTEMDATERSKKRLRELKVFRNIDERIGIEKVMDAASANYIDGISTALSWVRAILPNLFK